MMNTARHLVNTDCFSGLMPRFWVDRSEEQWWNNSSIRYYFGFRTTHSHTHTGRTKTRQLLCENVSARRNARKLYEHARGLKNSGKNQNYDLEKIGF